MIVQRQIPINYCTCEPFLCKKYCYDPNIKEYQTVTIVKLMETVLDYLDIGNTVYFIIVILVHLGTV